MHIDDEMTNEALVKFYQGASGKEEQSSIVGVLYDKNIKLVKKIASRYSRYETFDDLVQEGYFGIKCAADMYDENQGATFATYAFTWLKQTMLRYIANSGSVIRQSTNKHYSVLKLSRVITDFVMEIGREPSDRELCSLLGINQVQLSQIRKDKVLLRVRSLDEPLVEEDGFFTLGDTVADDRDDLNDIITIQDNERLRLILWDEINVSLSETEEEVIKKRFQECKTLKEVGIDMGITTESVRVIEAHAMRKLRKDKVIMQYRDDYISHAYCGTGLQSFLNTGTSSTERTAIDLIYEKGLDDYIRHQEIEENKNHI